MERWDGPQREVVTEGGARRSDLPLERAAWRLLVASHEGEVGPVVAKCAGCGLPMVADDPDAPPIPWVIPTPEGPLTVRGHGIGPERIGWAQATARVEQLYPAPRTREDYLSVGALAQSGLIVLMLVPALVWLAAIGAVVTFLVGITR